MAEWINLTSAWIPKLSGWSFVRPIKITEQSGNNLSDYQVLIELNSSNFDFSKAKADGGDIRFLLPSGKSIPYWIESWDKSGQSAKVWVKVPSIPANSSTVIYMYYGNSGATSESNAQNTFIRDIDSLKGAWHLDEGFGTTAHDSSGYNHDGTIYGATWVNGKFGKALEVTADGSKRVEIPDHTDFHCDTYFSIVAWVKIIDINGDWNDDIGGVVWRGNSVGWGSDYHGRIVVQTRTIDGQHKIQASWGSGGQDGTEYWFGGGILEKNVWYHLVYVADGSTLKGYKNGEEVGSRSANPPYKVDSYKIYFGYTNVGGQTVDPGIWHVDEVFWFCKALSPEEIQDLYNNYGYTTENYPGHLLVRKYTSPEPTFTVGPEIWL